MRSDKELWYDSRKLGGVHNTEAVLSIVADSPYTGFMVYPDNIASFDTFLDGPLDIIITTETSRDFEDVEEQLGVHSTRNQSVICRSSDLSLLDKIKAKGFSTCYQTTAHDESSLVSAIEKSDGHHYLLINFADPTNIPLELVIAKLQRSSTKVIKFIDDHTDADDAKAVYGVMEVGADGVVYSPLSVDHFEQVFSYLDQFHHPDIEIQSGTIISNRPVGMGYRSCIDLATLFRENESMIVGSTSQGGLLCCPEVFHLPYMDLRAFRVNAGGIHSYVFNVNDTTNYLSELKAGDSAMVTTLDGKIRTAVIGRIKTEIRPIRMIEVEFRDHERVNIIIQDDWHVRIYAEDGGPANSTELSVGDRVLGYTTKPGRHVGVRVDEFINEC